MTAHDSMSPTQFISLRELAGMKSGDYGGKVGDIAMKYYAEGGKHEDPGQDDRMTGVRRAVLSSGIREPLEVHRWADSSFGPAVDELHNGHHRAIVAMEHGIDPVPVRFVNRR